MKPATWIFAAVILVGISSFAAVTAFNSTPVSFEVTASADTYVSAATPSQVHGFDSTLWISPASAGSNWTLVTFDLFGKLRPGDLVVSAKIRFTVADTAGGPGSAVIRTARILSSWSEGNASWPNAPNVVYDTSTALALAQLPTAGAQIRVDVTKQLQRWHSFGGPSNYGVFLWVDASDPVRGIGFASRESTLGSGPVLELAYRPGPPGGYGYVLAARDSLGPLLRTT